MIRCRCKFTCFSVTKRTGFGEHEFVYDADFSPVSPDRSPENAEFFAATPSAAIRVSTVTHNRFTVGQDYYVDFTPASQGGDA